MAKDAADMPVLSYYLLVQTAAVAVLDLKTKKISNIWPVLNCALALILFIALPKVYFTSWQGWPLWIILVAVCVWLYAQRIMGAGDVKYLFSFFLVLPPAFRGEVLNILSLVIIVVGGYWLLKKVWGQWYYLLNLWSLGENQEILRLIHGKNVFAPLVFLAWALWLVLHYESAI